MTDSKLITLSDADADIHGPQACDVPPPASEAALRGLVDALPQIVWMTAPDGRPTYFNRQWLDYSGLTLEESLGNGWALLIHPDDSARVSQHSQQALAGLAPHDIEFRLRRADGIYRWMLCRATAQLDASGQPAQWLGTLTDIDDLKQSAQQLEKNLAMNRIAGRVAHLGGWTIDLPDRTLAWSDENCLIHDVPPGYQPTLEEGIGYFLPEHRDIVARYVHDCEHFGIPYEFVLPKVTAKGRLIFVRSIGEALRDASGKVIRLQGAFQDISEQKAAEARTHALEVQLITTLESITDGFCLINKNWQFTYLNGQAERMLKRHRQDIVGKTVWEEFPEALGSRLEREYRLALQTQRTARFDAFYPPLNVWFHFNVYPTAVGLAVYFQDITQRRHDQWQLRLLETAVSRLNDMVVIMEGEPFSEAGRRIVFVNDAFERLTGYSRDESIGKTPKLLWGANTDLDELGRILAAMEKWQSFRSEIAIYTKAGKELWLETDIAPIANAAGQFTHWVAVERDITERRQQRCEILKLNSELEERVLLRTAQLESANKELEAFAYSVSHDLRSPLNTIHAFSQLLMKSDAAHVSEKGKHYLDRIGVGAKQMGELIEGLLTLTHLSRGRIMSEPVDLSAMARRIDNDCRAREPQRQVQVRIQDGLHAQGDPRLLSSVLQNLLGNAWKFTARTEQAQIEVGCEPGAGGDTVFFVKDNGAGFDMAFVHKLFGTFERLHRLDEFTGTGVGLATVKRIIERHGGRVWAEGKVQDGARFFFTLGPAA